MSDRLLFRPDAAYGGHEYRVRQAGPAFGREVRVYERAPGASRFRCMRILTPAQWDAWVAANRHDLGNPARISRLANPDD